METKRMDWHLFWTAASVVAPLAAVILGCYVSLKNELNDVKSDINTIKTVLIVKGIIPKELATREQHGN